MDFQNIKVGSSYKKTPYIGTIYAKGGAGKTGLAVYAPSPFFICLEHGSNWIFGNHKLQGVAQTFLDQNGNVAQPSSSDDFFAALRWLCTRKNIAELERPIKTIVIDGMGFLERFFYKDLTVKLLTKKLGKEPTEEEIKASDIVDFGYDGQLKAMEYWERLFTGAEVLRRNGLNVIFITHALIKNADNPDGTRYKYIDMELQAYGNANVPNLFAKRSDFVYYLDSQVTTVKQGSGKWIKHVATSSDSMFQVHTRQTPLFYAKSRSVDGNQIPDTYFFTLDDREQVAKQIFEDLDKC